MSLFLFGAAKGSPGSTTTVLALGASWPAHREPLIVEADPSGGDIVTRLASLEGDTSGLRDTPSTVQLAARGRGGLSFNALIEHAQRLPGTGEVRAVVAPASAFAASTALTELVAAGLYEQFISAASYDVLVDVGRIDPGSPALDLVRSARRVVLVCRPTLESVAHTRDLVSALAGLGARSSVIVIGDRPYAPRDVAEAVGAELVGELPNDATGAAALAGEARNPKVVARTRLIRTARVIAEGLAPPPQVSIDPKAEPIVTGGPLP